MSGNRRYSPRRFRELTLYVLSQLPLKATAQDVRNVLWRIDMEAYRHLGRSVTGATYVKTEEGVVPHKKGRRGMEQVL